MKRRSGNVLLAIITVLVTGNAAAFAVERPRGSRFALLVGVGRYYEKQLKALPGAEPDMADLARVLTSSGYAHEDVVLMTNRAGAEDPRRMPTASRIRKQLKRLSQNKQPGDCIVIALAGHGLQRKRDDYCFCPVDANLKNPQSLISIEEVYASLRDCGAEFKLVMVDACREDVSSGETQIGSDGIRSVSRGRVGRGNNLPEPPPRTAAFFSCAPSQLAYERSDELGAHGVFFHAVIRGLKGAAGGDDGNVTLPDLERFVKKDVQGYVRTTYSASQYPVIRNNTRGLTPLVAFSRREKQLKRARDLWVRSRREEARAMVDQLLEERPSDALALAEQSQMAAEDGESKGDSQLLKQALTLAERAIQLAPNAAQPYVARANVARVRKQYELALADCALAIERNPNCLMAYVQRAAIYKHIQNHDAMMRDVQTALEIDKSDPVARALYAGLLFSLGRMEEGFVELERGAAVTPDVPMLHFMKGYGLDQQGRYDEAILAYTAAIRLDDQDEDLFCRRAISLANAGDYLAANEDANAAERLNPNSVDAVSARVVILNHQKKYAEIVSLVTRALERHPDSEDLLLGRGCAYFYGNQPQKALEDFARLLELNPAHANGHAITGVIKMQAGNADEAMVHLDRATRHDARLALAHYTKAAILVKRQDFASALPHISQAIECAPNNAQWYQQRAAILNRLGRTNEARRDLAKHASLTSGNP